MSQRPGPRPGTAGGLGVRRRCRCEAQGGCGYRWRWRGWLTVYGVALRGGGPATPCLLPRARTPAHQARSLCHTRTALRQVHVCEYTFLNLLCVTHTLFDFFVIFSLHLPDTAHAHGGGDGRKNEKPLAGVRVRVRPPRVRRRLGGAGPGGGLLPSRWTLSPRGLGELGLPLRSVSLSRQKKTHATRTHGKQA